MGFSNFTKNIRGLWLGTFENYNDIIVPSKMGAVNGVFNTENAECISTVYTCVKILSETISRLPLNIYSDKGEGRTVDKDDYRYPILHYNPNNWTNSQTFFSALEYWRSLKGNSFARIYRDKYGKVISLTLIPPSRVTGYGIEGSELYYFVINDSNNEEKINSNDILHFRGITKDGIWGISNISALYMNLSISFQGMQTIDNFYRNNAASPKAIKSSIGGSNQMILDGMLEFERKYQGAMNAGKMQILPPNTEIIDMALNYQDAEFINTFKFNAGQISSMFGVPPEMVGLFEASKFNNVEQMQLHFKSNTMANIARIYRQEMEHKLLTTEERLRGVSIEFNLMAMVEADSTTRINNLRTLANLGVVTPNDICRLEGFKTYKEGEKHLILGNYKPVEDIANPSINKQEKTEIDMNI